MAGLGVIGDFTKSYRGIISYLHQGGTWKRLQDIATTPVEDGGAGLMQEFSNDVIAVFRPTPPTSVDSRLEQTDHAFLKWLAAGRREEVLVRCIEVDVEQRGITGSKAALDTLRSPFDRIRRIIVMVMLRRCLFLHRFANAPEHIALHSTPEDVISKAVEVVLAIEPDEEFLELIGLSLDTIVPMAA